MVTIGIPLGILIALVGIILYLVTKRRSLALTLVAVGIVLVAASALLWALIVASPM